MARIIDSDFLHRALLHFYGYSSFRTGQEEIISEILHGQPVLAVLLRVQARASAFSCLRCC